MDKRKKTIKFHQDSLTVPDDVALMLDDYARKISTEEQFNVTRQQAFERLVRIALGVRNNGNTN